MYPLLLCSVVAVAVVLDRSCALLTFLWTNRRERKLWNALIHSHQSGAEIPTLPLKPKSPLLRIVAATQHVPAEQLEDALTLAAQREVDTLRRRLSLLDTIITAAPLLGILGTVTGIIATFDAMSIQATANPASVSGGIAEALITTATGLIIALGALLPYNLFVSAIQRQTAQLTEAIHTYKTAVTSRCNS